MNKQIFLSVKKAAKLLEVSEETVRRAIRNGKLRANRKGRELFIHEWELESYILDEQQIAYDEPLMILNASRGILEMQKGALLFDQLYFQVEEQYHRIEEDKNQLHNALEFNKKRISDLRKLREKGGNVKYKQVNWSYYLRLFFMDIHFYFVAAEGLKKSCNMLKESNENEDFSIIISKYDSLFKDLCDIRNFLEHIDKEIKTNSTKDLGNYSTLRGFSFGGKYYQFYIDEIRQLRHEICDYLLEKTLPEVTL